MKSRMMNKLCALAMVPVMAVGGALVSGALNGVVVSAAEKAVTDYSYTITPLLAPFNEFFFVKTDNPDPLSFRFVDSSSRYSDESSIEFDWDDWDETINLYADVRFDDPEIGIEWPQIEGEVLTSEKDLKAKRFADADYFE